MAFLNIARILKAGGHSVTAFVASTLRTSARIVRPTSKRRLTSILPIIQSTRVVPYEAFKKVLDRAVIAEKNAAKKDVQLAGRDEKIKRLNVYEDRIYEREELKKHFVRSALWKVYTNNGKKWDNLFPANI